MRMTKRKQVILDWLNCTDITELTHRCTEHGHNTIGGLCVAVYDVHNFDATPSQLRSLYATLAGMVNDGLLEVTYTTNSTQRTNYRETHWHNAGMIERDNVLMIEVDKIRRQRQQQTQDKFLR